MRLFVSLSDRRLRAFWRPFISEILALETSNPPSLFKSAGVIGPEGLPSTWPKEPPRRLWKLIRSFGFGSDPGLRIIPNPKVPSENSFTCNAKVAGVFCVAGGLLGGLLGGLGRGG